jgi:hypothetical protein
MWVGCMSRRRDETGRDAGVASQQGFEAEQIVCPPADRFVWNLAAAFA